MKIEKLIVPILIIVILILLFPTIKREWDRYNNESDSVAYVPETSNGGNASMYLYVGRGSIPFNNDTK